MDALVNTLAGFALLVLAALLAPFSHRREIRVGPIARPTNWWKD